MPDIVPLDGEAYVRRWVLKCKVVFLNKGK